jgi:hypothetical protein
MPQAQVLVFPVAIGDGLAASVGKLNDLIVFSL